MKEKLLAVFICMVALLFSLGTASAIPFSEGDDPWIENIQLDSTFLVHLNDRHLSDDDADFTIDSAMLLALFFGRFQSWRTGLTHGNWEPPRWARFREAVDDWTPMDDLAQTGNIHRHGNGQAPSPVPEPATMLLLGTGLLLCAAFSRKKSKTNL
jgi:hypothetical protein